MSVLNTAELNSETPGKHVPSSFQLPSLSLGIFFVFCILKNMWSDNVR